MIIDLAAYYDLDDTPSPVDNDDQIQAAIDAASAWIENLTGRTFVVLSLSPSPSPASTIDILNGHGTTRQHTKNGPITAVDCVEYWDGMNWFEYDVVGYPYTYKVGSNCVYFTNGHTFVRGKMNIRITYSYGYATEIPRDLQYACYLLAKHILLEAERQGINMQQDGQQQFSYNHDLPKTFQPIIDRYKMVW